MNRRDDIELDEKQKQLVRAFLMAILPPTNSKRHGKNNELSTITKAVDKWFKRNFEFNVGLNALAEIFEELEQNGYSLRSKRELDEYRGETPYVKRKAMNIYVNIEPTRVTSIRRLSTTLPPNTNPEKQMDLVPIQDELRTFLVNHRLG